MGIDVCAAKKLWNQVASLCETASGVSLCGPEILLGRIRECFFTVSVYEHLAEEMCQKKGVPTKCLGSPSPAQTDGSIEWREEQQGCKISSYRQAIKTSGI